MDIWGNGHFGANAHNLRPMSIGASGQCGHLG